MRKLLSVIVVLMMSNVLYAQDIKENLKFGNPTPEEMAMTQTSIDSDAVAVVLCDLRKEYFRIDNSSFYKITERKRRIKVLKQEGTEYANVSFVYYDPKSTTSGTQEKIYGISATAYNTENGKVVSTKMKSNLVFRERIDDNRMLLKFTIPQVKVGTVIEYQYSESSDNPFIIDTWYAQGNIPVLYTKYDLMLPEFYHFSVEHSGRCHLDVETKSVPEHYAIDAHDDISSSSTNYIFVGRNLSSLKDDNSLWCVNDYRTKVTADLQYVQYPGYFKSYTSTWEDVTKILMDMDGFGDHLSKSTPLQSEINGLNLSSIENIDDKVAALCKLLISRVKWDGDYTLLSQKSASSVLKKGVGSSSDLNFMLINMLNASGIEAYPLAIRLREYGRLPMTHASISKLSTFVVAYKRSETEWGLVDATSREGYVDVLNPQLMPYQGWLLKTDGATWIKPCDRCKEREVIRAEVDLQPDGTLVGKRSFKHMYESSLIFKTLMKANDSIDVKERLSNELEATVTDESLDCDVNDYTNSITETIHFTKKCQTGGDIIYINPFVFPIWDENPYSRETRDVPIERLCTATDDNVTVITLPDGYDVEEMPQSIILNTEDGSITCKIFFNKSDNKIVSRYNYAVKSMFFEASAYPDIRQLYEHIVSKCNEMIAIKKK